MIVKGGLPPKGRNALLTNSEPLPFILYLLDKACDKRIAVSFFPAGGKDSRHTLSAITLHDIDSKYTLFCLKPCTPRLKCTAI